jgi:hypothetical protein
VPPSQICRWASSPPLSLPSTQPLSSRFSKFYSHRLSVYRALPSAWCSHVWEPFLVAPTRERSHVVSPPTQDLSSSLMQPQAFRCKFASLPPHFSFGVKSQHRDYLRHLSSSLTL